MPILEIGIMPYVWLVVAVLLFIMEALTVQLVSIWLGIAALITILPAAFGTSIGVQLIVFTISSIILLIFTKPFCKKIINKKKIYHTNADQVIGKTAVVIEEINNLNSAGRIMVDGIYWTARSQNGEVIPESDEVIINKIEGVKVIVEKISAKNSN